MEKFSLEALREFLQEESNGQIFDSLIAVEIGLEDYELSWLAHQDYLEDVMPEALAEIGSACMGYLIHMAMELEVDDSTFEKLIETPS